MKKINSICGVFLAIVWGSATAAWGQGHHNPPVPPPHPVPTPTPIHVVPHPPVHVVPPRPIELPSNVHPIQAPVPKPVVVAPQHRPAVGPQVNPFLHQPNQGVVGRRPIVVTAERNKVIRQNWQKAMVVPKQAVDLSLRHRDFGRQVQTYFRPRQREWFQQDWWNQHAGFAKSYPWHYSHYFHLHPYNYWWRPATWVGLCGWYAAPWGAPLYYDYGNNVVFQNDMVYINDVPVASMEEYASQAYDLANVQAPPPNQPIDWMPLGTFALSTSKEDTQPTHTLQLAMSKTGLISGTYLDTTTNQAIAAEGRVDPATQRVAIRLPENPDFVLETGVYNLTQDQTPVLVHFGTDQTQTWYLVRLQSDEKP